MSNCEGSVSIRPSGTIRFSLAGIITLGAHDVDYVTFYRARGCGTATRPLLLSERRELGLSGPGPFAEYPEDDPLEFLSMVGIKHRKDRHYYAWLEDQRLVGSHVGVIVTTTMPKGVENFDRLDSVWVANMRCILPLAKALRLALVEMALIKGAAQGKDGKMHRLYAFMTGMQFRMRVSSMVEACVGMQEDLDAEKRAMTKQWAKKQRRMEILMTELASTWGDLQGIVGKGMAELHGLNVPRLDDPLSTELLDESSADEDGASKGA
jgi:hypothetical protein